MGANQLKVGLKGDFELNPQSLLYKLVVSKYRILTPFARRHSELEFFWDKKNKNVVMNKFYAKAKVDKDGSKVADVLISTNQQPYKFHVFLPSLLGKLRSGMQEVDVDVAHNPGTSLEMKVNHAGAKFKGFKIAKTGSGSEREITWNGKKLSFDVNNADLNGKFMKVYAGKEYSVVFQPGFTMPSIKIGA